MDFIVCLLTTTMIILMMALIFPKIEVRKKNGAIVVALSLGFLNSSVGFLHFLPINFYIIIAICFVTRLIITLGVIKADSDMRGGFKFKGFTPAVIFTAILCFIGVLLDHIFH